MLSFRSIRNLHLVIPGVLCLFWQNGYGQNLAIQTTDAFCRDLAAPIQISALASIDGPDSDILEGVQIAVTENFDHTLDSFTYTFADGIQGDFDPQNGIFTLNGQASIAEYRDALDRLYFNTPVENTKPKTINITLSGVDFLAETGHFYQYFSSPGISWSEARDAAQSQDLFGLEGYLTTITTSTENKFILERVSGSAWIGASDEQSEGVWRWITGPERNQNGGQGMLLADGFTNWDDNEPNNYGNEDFAHMMDWSSPAGRWNDLPDQGGSGQYSPTGYIVEYGGLANDPDVLSQISGNVVVEFRKSIEVTGPISVCPNIEGVIYNATALDGHSYIWTIDGGSIMAGQGTDEITVNWGFTNANAYIKVEVISDLVCTYEETLNVRINEVLEPPAPVGPLAVCFDDLTTAQTYNTPATPGSTYIWQITNGQIISGNGTNEVEVLWDQPGTGTLFFTESTSTSTDICDGDSPTIDVILREEVEVAFDIENVSCFGGNDGAAEFQLLSQAGSLAIEWIVPNSASVNGTQVDGLFAGVYEILVTADDCKKYFSFEITEPEALAGSMDIADVRCFGERNGFAQASITGGTEAYTYQWSHNNSLGASSAGDLPAGDHSVRIIDKNNCELTLNFTINEPELLVIDEVLSTLISCPGGNDGTLEALVSGGTAPYSFVWDDNTATTSLATGYEKGTYTVRVIDANGCEATASQEVDETIPKVVLPNAFTPNNDEMNETFGPSTPCDIIFKMEVYNRWGQVIFSTKSTSNQWDGNFKGEPLASGKYSYAASWVIEANGLVLEESKKGEIQLIR